MKVSEWSGLLARGGEEAIAEALQKHLNIQDNQSEIELKVKEEPPQVYGAT